MQSTRADGSAQCGGIEETSGSGFDFTRDIQGRIGELKKRYAKFPKRPLEWKIQEYVRLLDDGWGRNYARAQAGLKCGRRDYKAAMLDERVHAAHERNREAFISKQRRKLGR